VLAAPDRDQLLILLPVDLRHRFLIKGGRRRRRRQYPKAGQPVDRLLQVGRDRIPADLRHQPEHLRAYQYHRETAVVYILAKKLPDRIILRKDTRPQKQQREKKNPSI